MLFGSQKRHHELRDLATIVPEEPLADLLDAETLGRARIQFRDQLQATRPLATAGADRATRARQAHALISSAVVLGFGPLSRACIDVELALESDLFDSQCASMQTHVEAALEALDCDDGASG